MSTRHFSAERMRRNGASISSGGLIATNRQRRANPATSNSSAISSRFIAKTWKEVGKDIGRSKTASLSFLDERLGHLRLPEPDRERFIKFGKARALEGAGPVTVGIDLGYIKTILSTAMRQDEIARVEWRDFDAGGRMLLIRNRKDPRKKNGNDQRIPLLDVSGYDACKIIEEQGRFSNIREGRIFPYNGRSVGAAFRRQYRDLKIDDLHFHDLRHEGTSRLFEAGFSIEQVALVTGHKDWKMLRRYTHLKPETLHSRRKANVA
jgi:integrase